jgi:hypothetical protein
VAALFGVRPETINKRIRDTRRLLDHTDHTIRSAEPHLSRVDDLYDLARTAGITIPGSTTPAS